MATLKGTVVASAALENAPPMVAAIVWTGIRDANNEAEPRMVGERVQVTGDFPATFTLNVYAPPPSELLYVFESDEFELENDFHTGTVMGFIAAIDANADDEDIQPEDILGVDTTHRVIYLDRDISTEELTYEEEEALPPDERLRHRHDSRLQLLNIPASPGYHLAKYRPEYVAGRDELLECKWKEVCVQWISTRDNPESQQKGYDTMLAECLVLFPENETCQAWNLPEIDTGDSFPGENEAKQAIIDAEPEWSADCRELYETSSPRESCESGWSSTQRDHDDMPFVESPADLADPVTIELGKSKFWAP
jgi:hypothetical protein